MYKVKIYTIGKTKEPWLQEILAEYETRLHKTLSIEWVLCKNPIQLEQILEKQNRFICLSPEGKQYTSVDFSSSFIRWLEELDSRLSFVIGGAEGIPSSIKSKAFCILSLSKMTFTHQITRLLLVEQIYRALEIQKGSAYSK